MKNEIDMILEELENLGKPSDEVIFWKKVVTLMNDEEIEDLLVTLKEERAIRQK